MNQNTFQNLRCCMPIFLLPVAESNAYIYDDEATLAIEMAQALPVNTQDQARPEIDPDDFEELYQWFIS